MPPTLPELNPAKKDADEKLALTNNDIPYTGGDSDRRKLAEREQSGNPLYTNSEYENHFNYKSDQPTASQPAQKGGLLTKAGKSLVGGSSWKKKAGIAGLVSGGISLAVLAIIMFVMLATGFGIKQVAIVVRNFSFARIYNTAAKESGRFLNAKAEAAVDPSIAEIKDPAESAKELSNLDLDKVVQNVDGEKIKVGKSASGGAEVTIGESPPIDTSTPEGMKTLTDKIADDNVLHNKSVKFENPVADEGIIKVNGVKQGWSEKVVEESRTKDLSQSELNALEHTDEYKYVKGEPETRSGSREVKAAEDAITDSKTGIAGSVANAEDTESVPAIGRGIAAAANFLEKDFIQKVLKFFDVIGGVPMFIIMGVCTLHQIIAPYQTEIRNAQSQAQRQALLLQSQNDQIQTGAVSGAVVGASVAVLGNIGMSGAYQQAVYNPAALDAQSYDQLPASDYPIPKPHGALNLFIKVDNFIRHGPGSTPFTGAAIDLVCNAMSNPTIAIGAGVVAVALNLLLVLLPGAGEVEAAADGGLAEVAGTSGTVLAEVEASIVEDGVQQGLMATLRSIVKTIGNPGGFVIDKAADYAGTASNPLFSRLLAASVSAGLNVGTEVGKYWALGFFATKLASMNKGEIYNGTDDAQAVNRSGAGADLLQSQQQHIQDYGVELSDSEVEAQDKAQVLTFLDSQRSKSFFARFINVNDPYSVASKSLLSPSTEVAKIGHSPTAFLATIRSTIAQQIARVNPLNKDNVLSQFASAAIMPSSVVLAASKKMTINHYDIPQFGWTLAEQNTRDNNPSYSFTKILRWAEANAGTVHDFDSAFAACFSTKTPFVSTLKTERNYFLGPETQGPDGNVCSDPKITPSGKVLHLTDDTGFRWRLYHADKNQLDSYKYVESVSNSSSTGGGGTGTGGGGGTLPAGNLQQLAQQIVDLHKQGKITYAVDPTELEQNFERMAQGQPPLTDTGHEVTPDPIILQAIIYLAQQGTVQLNSYVDGSSHTQPGNPHYEGKAIDIGAFNGKTLGSANQSVTEDVESIVADVLPAGARFGADFYTDSTWSTPLTLKGKVFHTGKDTGGHLHVDVLKV